MNVYICEATKNRFAILENTKLQEKSVETELILPKLNQVAQKESCDGYIVLQAKSKKQEHIFDWLFFNKDGSTAEMCGNAARCVAKILQQIHHVNKATLISNFVDYKLEMLDQDEAKVTFPKKFSIQKLNLHLDLLINGYFTNTGVPHFILNQEPDIHLAKKIRNSLHFPNGTNVTFVFDQENDNTFYASTYERGVEGFTPACGTGAVAAGTFLQYKKNLEHCNIKMSGGNLKVQIFQAETVLTGDVFIINKIEIVDIGEK